MQQQLRYVRSAPTVVHLLIHHTHIVIHVIPHVMIVDMYVLRLITTHTLVRQAVVTDAAQQELHLTIVSMQQQLRYVRSVLIVVHPLIHHTHIVIHVIQHVMTVDILVRHLIHIHTLAQQVVDMDVEQHEQHIIMLVRQMSSGHTGQPLVLQKP